MKLHQVMDNFLIILNIKLSEKDMDITNGIDGYLIP